MSPEEVVRYARIKDLSAIALTDHDTFAGIEEGLSEEEAVADIGTVEDISAGLAYSVIKNALLKVRCFGNFEVFNLNNIPLHFERSKAKEVFAYLIYKHGASCTIKEIAAVLFEDEPYDRKQQGYTQKIISFPHMKNCCHCYRNKFWNPVWCLYNRC